MGGAGRRLDLDLLAGDEVQHVEAIGGVVRDAFLEVEPVHPEEEVGQPTELELRPARGAAYAPRFGNELAPHRLPRAARIEVREGMREVNGPQLSVQVAAQPVVEAKCVEIRRRA